MTVEVRHIGKVTADRETLNILVGVLYEAADLRKARAEERGKDNPELSKAYKACAGFAAEGASDIFEALKSVGYYDDVLKK